MIFEVQVSVDDEYTLPPMFAFQSIVHPRSINVRLVSHCYGTLCHRQNVHVSVKSMLLDHFKVDQ